MSTIDPKGTSPKPVEAEPEAAPTLNMRCPRNCGSITCTELVVPGIAAGSHLYKCTKCNHTWSTSVGGYFPY